MATNNGIKNLIRQQYIGDNAGFTMMEMMVIIMIVGILSAIAAPAWVQFSKRQRLNQARNGVLSVIQQAQTQAKKTKRTYSISFRVNSSTNIPEYIIYQGTPSTTNPSNSWTTSTSGWIALGDTVVLKSRQVFLYTNLTSLTTVTAYNTTTTDKQIVQTATGSGTITFDSQGILANKSSGSVADTPLAIMVATPLSTGSTASSIDRCIIIQSLIGGTRTAKDTDCQTLSTGS
jgi:prepilin-type N-terminal cleavage/methylation domain-containing protein